MVVNVALKVGKVGQEHGGGNGAMAHVGGNNAYSNNNFGNVFFYSSFGEVVEGSSFEKIGMRRSLGHHRARVVSPRLGVLPKLLSREEMGVVWNDASSARVRKHEKPLSQLRLEDGKEMLARIALFIYLRPGMKKLILAGNWLFSWPAEMVNCLMHFMGLDDPEFVNDHIKIGKGRQSQGRMNYVSQYENKTINKDHYEADLSISVWGTSYKAAALESKMKKRAEAEATEELTNAKAKRR